MVRGVEDLRTPLHRILHIESRIRGRVAGFMTPQFMVDLPGGGGKRLASSYESYDRETGVSRFSAPGVKGEEMGFEYNDPLPCISSLKTEFSLGMSSDGVQEERRLEGVT